jgi:TonB family protein
MRAAGPVELDAVPKPVGDTHFDIPKRLRREPVKGGVKVDLVLAEDGRVLQARVVDTDLPAELSPHLERSIETWQFTPPTVNGGCPVKIKAALPIPVEIR